MAAANEKLAVNLTSSAAAVAAPAAPLSKAAPAMNAAFGGDVMAPMAPAGVSAGLMGAPLNVASRGVPMPPPSAFGVEPTPNAASGDPFAKFGGAVSTGTTIMAVAFDGGVVIAADSRTSTGDYVSNRVSDKLTKIHDRIYCARSGSAADTQAISDIVNYYLDLHAVELDTLPRVETAAHLFQNIIYQNKNALMAGIIVAGWDKKDGGSVWSITLGGTCVKQPFAIGGSGSAYIYGLCDAEWRKYHGDGKDGKEQKKMTRDDCESFVQRAVSHAMARDGSSGGVIRMCTITKDGCDRKFTAGDKLAFQAEWMK